MVKLNEVLEFIKNSDKADISTIIKQSRIRRSELTYDMKSSFKVGDIVGIDHKSVNSDDSFRITKINIKNINVQKIGQMKGRVHGTIRVSPILLIKK